MTSANHQSSTNDRFFILQVTSTCQNQYVVVEPVRCKGLLHKANRWLQIIYKHYQRALSQWPVDVLRPQVSFQTIMRQRIEKHFNPPKIAPQGNVVANETLATVPTPVKFDEKTELEQVNVLYSFLENRYMKKVLFGYSSLGLKQ